MKARFVIGLTLLAATLAWSAPACSQEVFVGNPGKSLNFFIFDLALEKGHFKELGLDVKLLSISSKPGAAR